MFSGFGVRSPKIVYPEQSRKQKTNGGSKYQPSQARWQGHCCICHRKTSTFEKEVLREDGVCFHINCLFQDCSNAGIERPPLLFLGPIKEYLQSEAKKIAVIGNPQSLKAIALTFYKISGEQLVL